MNNTRTCTGFTLIEMVMTLIIVGILAVVAIPRFFETSRFDQRGFQDELLSAIRYAQKTAVASQCPVQVNIDASAERYDLFLPNNTNPATCANSPVFGANPVQQPGGGAFGRAAPSGVDISTNLVVTFNSLGQPSSGGNTNVGSLPVIIEPETGYAHD